MAVEEVEVEGVVVEEVISLSVNLMGRWVTLFSNVVIVLTHS